MDPSATPRRPGADTVDSMDPTHPGTPALALATTAERVGLARRTHRSLVRGFAWLYGTLAAVIVGAGYFLIPEGRANLAGITVIVGVFLLIPVAAGVWIRRLERRAERFLAADGTTLLRADPHGVTVADVVLPYERITCLYANVEQETYSDGGLRGEVMAYRLGLSDNRPTVGRRIGALFGTGMRRRLYATGAKSGIFLCIGVDRKSLLAAPPGLVERARLAPQRGDDPGRIIMPFGAYLGAADLKELLDSVRDFTDGTLFPLGVVSGTMNWAAAQVGTSDARAVIWQDSKALLAA